MGWESISPGMVVYTRNPSTWEVKAGGWEVQDHLQPHSQPLCLLPHTFGGQLGKAWWFGKGPLDSARLLALSVASWHDGRLLWGPYH